MKTSIAITGLSSISPLGGSLNEVWQNYTLYKSKITSESIQGTQALMARIPSHAQQEILELKNENPKFKSLDNSVLFAIYAARKAVAMAGWKTKNDFGINVGSSRGATELFEKYYQDFLETNSAKTLASPTTTLGNISSWLAQDLRNVGPEISHSITCSTALHALINGVAWLNASMADAFLVGGSEAPLTPFTIAQMRALKIYAKEQTEYSCRALDLLKNQNTMVLGEGAAMICLEKPSDKKALAYVSGIGYATEELTHGIAITEDAQCFQKSMKMALEGHDLSSVDAIVMHAPGTIKGDLSEFKAIEKLFGNKLPMLTTNKWMIGHTFGASGMLSVEMAILMMQNQEFIASPFYKVNSEGKPLNKVLVNAVGFGGNAVSVLLSNQL